jgi:predicted Fe-Mo cluster-binding NifX family protein
MKIAIPTKENMVDGHFGHCESFTVFTFNEHHTIVKEERFEPASGCGCKSNLAETFQQMGISALLAGGIGQGAINNLNQYGIEVLRGCSGDVRKLAEEFAKGAISDSGETCNHHQQHHGDGGHGGSCHHS